MAIDVPDAPFAVVTGGGTAGHVLPALAVAEALVARGHPPTEIRYVGCARGIETELVPDTPFPATFHDVVGLQRSFSRRNLSFVPKMIRATRAAIREFTAARPSVVVSVGGYASMPSVFAARRLRIPIVVVSYDRRPGRASRLASRSAVACAVAFEGSTLPRAELTGAPVRQSIIDVDRTGGRRAARQRLGIADDRFLVAVMGGSLGSKALNDAILGYLRGRSSDDALAVRHVAGRRFVDDVSEASSAGGGSGPIHQVLGFEPAMDVVYAAADLLVGRGGASTVHEVAVTGIPAILVPWAGAAEDHQTDNVSWLADNGAAVMVSEADLGRLGGEIERLRADDDARGRLAVAAHRCGEVHRSGALAGLIERVAVTSVPS